ncbi:MAG: alpha/beta fold hydrolase [Bacteroidota bacterium]|nr:alpha/beta fold hydrolase [Bacteroidota bacterium]
MIKRKILTTVFIIIAAYFVFGIALYFFQERIIFQSKRLPQDHQFKFDQPFTEKNIRYDDETNFNMIEFSVKDDSIAKGIVLYFHGNKENVNHYAKYAINFTKNGYEVWMPDYPGYGKSTGKISEEILYQESMLVYNLAREKYKPQQIIIYGRSLGTGIAARLAGIKDCKKLILETPYKNFPALLHHYLWMYPISWKQKYKMPTYQYLQNVKVPVTIFHGTNDEIIPYKKTIELKKVLKNGDEFISIEKGRHNNLNDFDLFHQKLDSLLR